MLVPSKRKNTGKAAKRSRPTSQKTSALPRLVAISARPIKVGIPAGAEHRASAARASIVLEKNREWLHGFQGVVGLEVAPRLVAGKPTGVVSIRVHVIRKRSPDKLHPEHRLPAQLEGVPIDVIESRYKPTSLAASLAKRRELVGGVSLGSPGTTTLATLACLCLDGSGVAMGLSAAHPWVGSPLVAQPAGGGQADLIGAAASLHLNTELDAATIALKPGSRDVRGGAAGCWGPRRLGTISADQAGYVPVLMVGAMSGWRRGLARLLGTPVPVNYPPPTGPLMMENQIHLISEDGTSALNQPGDSGALLMSEDGEAALGLVIAAGDPDDDGPATPFGIATPIQTVVKKLGIRLANPS